MAEYNWTFPPELLIDIIQEVERGRITRHEGKMRIRNYLDEKYPEAKKRR
jgi:hypothetical protein